MGEMAPQQQWLLPTTCVTKCRIRIQHNNTSAGTYILGIQWNVVMKLMYLLFALSHLATAPCAHSEELTPLELGKKLRAESDNGNADSMLMLARLLAKYAPEAKRPYTICDGKLVNPLIKQNTSGKDCKTVEDSKNKALLAEWSAVGTKWQVNDWITKAAQGGSEEAIGIKCSIASDEYAPAEMREQAHYWCSKRQSTISLSD